MFKSKARKALDPGTAIPPSSGVELRSETYSVGDPAFAQWFGLGSVSLAGVSVTESSAIGLSAVFRSVDLLSGIAADLPLKSYRDNGTERKQVQTWVDNPCPWLTPFEFKKLVMVNLLLQGNFYGLHIYGGANQILGLAPIHPSCVLVEWEKDSAGNATGQKIYKIGDREFTSADICHVMGLSLDGLRGESPISIARNGLGTALAGDQAAARMFGSGALLSGLVSSEEDVTADEAKVISQSLKNNMQGVKNAGEIMFVNRTLKFTPWTMSNEDAQFLESRQFQVEEVARLYGVPKVLLAQDGASTWGSGVAELNRGLAKYTLRNHTTPIEERFSQLLSRPTFCEFDYKGLLAGTPKEEIELLVLQVEKGLITINEARAIMNLPPLPEATPVTPLEGI